MTKKELQKELIEILKRSDDVIREYSEGTEPRIYAEGRQSGLKYALQLIEHLDEGTKV